MSTWRSILALVVVASLIAISGMVAFRSRKPLGPEPRIDFPATTPPTSALFEFLEGEFTVVRDVRALPSPVLTAFTEVGGQRPLMANPGKKFEAGDVITDASIPRKRLLFAGVSNAKCLVHYEQGGIGHSYVLALFRLTHDGMEPVWKGYCGPARDVQGLRSEIQKGACSH